VTDPRAREQYDRAKWEAEANAQFDRMRVPGHEPDRAREQMTPEERYAGLIADAEDRRDQDTIDALRRLAGLERLVASLVMDNGPNDLRLEVRPKAGPAGNRMWFAGLWRFASDYAEEGGCWAFTPWEALVRLAEALEAGDG
jgi:hypothetical protein